MSYAINRREIVVKYQSKNNLRLSIRGKSKKINHKIISYTV